MSPRCPTDLAVRRRAPSDPARRRFAVLVGSLAGLALLVVGRRCQEPELAWVVRPTASFPAQHRTRFGASRRTRLALAAAEAPFVEVGVQDEGRGGDEEKWQAERSKGELLRLCAAQNRGLDSSPAVQEMMGNLVARLEGTYRAPADTALRQQALNGSWAVIFTTSPDLTSLERLPLPGWRAARIGQAFDYSGEARNEIEFVSPFGTRVNQTVQCQWGIADSDGAKFRVRLGFVGSSTKLAAIAGLPTPVLPPLAFPLPPAAGIFEVSFLDDELLIQRTRAGARGYNVLVRETR